MKRWQRMAGALAAAAVGIILGRVEGAASHRAALRLAQQTEQELNRQLLEAVQRHLEKAHLPPRDLPKTVLDTTPLGDRRYRVHLAMGEGEAWFEVRWDGTAWQVKGLNPPEGQPESQAPGR